MSGKVLKIISNVLFVLFAFVLILVLYAFISIHILNRPYVNFFSYTVFQIGSNSMAPAITTNDLIVVHLTDQVQKDDIITYREGESFVTHRLMEVEENSYLTKGDKNNEFDDPVLKDDVIGKVVKVLPKAGVWFRVITTPKVIVLICVTLFLFSLAFSYTGNKKLSKNDDFGIYYSGIEMKKGAHHD